MEKLIPMTDFVLEQSEKDEALLSNNAMVGIGTALDNYLIIKNYANFLKKPLKLSYFVPCYVRDGIEIPYTGNTDISSMELFKEFEEAKERVLFDGIEKSKVEWIMFHYSTIEDISNLINDLDFEIKLTETAKEKVKKEIGLI